MIAIAWNCQGLGNTLTVRHLKDISSQYGPQVYFLSETKQQRNYLEKVCRDIKCHDLFTVEPQGASGGLALLWHEDVEVTILSSSDRWIDARIKWQNKFFLITGIYGDPVTSEREAVWERIIEIGEHRTEAWIMLGDFNELYNNEDKRGGRIRPEASFFPFRNMLTNCGLLELPFKGNPFSWFGNRGGELIHCKLDRVVANVEFYVQYPAATTLYLPRIGSDHSPILSLFNGEGLRRKGQFRYDCRWFEKDGFTEVIKSSWSASTHHESDLVSQLRSCRSALSDWKKRTHTNSYRDIQLLKQQIDTITHDPSLNWDTYKLLKCQLATAYNQEELYWKQRSRAHWLKEGDKNSKYFHMSVKQKRVQNRIRCLVDDSSGSTIYNDSDMGKFACSFFANLYTSEIRNHPHVMSSGFFNGISSKVTSEQNSQLIRSPSDGEIKMAAFGMSPHKCAGPDGFSGSFFQQNWDVVGPTICEMIRQFMLHGTFDNRLNETAICLIPKKQRATRLTEFRPISLCNFAYKILSKLLASRLKILLPNIITETQAAFVQGRLISDNILLAHEILHSIKINPDLADSSMAIKTDMMKAFDRVEWQFLEDSLTVLGFHTTWITWIMQCVSTVSYGVIVNGQRYGHFSPSRGLRQGDPLSPFLFILCTEILILRLNRGDPVHHFLGLKVATSAPHISHLFFADDSLFFSSVEENQLRALQHILGEYEELSGQKVNKQKSSILFGPKVSQEKRELARSIIGIAQEGGRGLYLGLPETFIGSKTETLQFIEERIQARIGSWKNKYLSQGGKEILVKAVAQAIPAYVMSCYLLPKGLIEKITADLARFWWRNQDTGKGIHWKTWDSLAQRKDKGGLNFRHLEGFNLALLGKQLWRLCNNPNTLLARTLQAKYHPREASVYHAKLGNRPSYGWKSIMEGKNLLSLGLKKEFGNGADIDLYRDPWIVDGVPRGARALTDVIPSLVQLKEPNSEEWNVNSLLNFFAPEECQKILQVKPGGVESRSLFSWIHNNSGIYSVKSGYWLWSTSSLNQSKATEQLPNHSAIYSAIWKVEANNKIKHFLWRCLSSSLPVYSELHKRHIKDTTSCSLCGFESEDINHLLFKCDLAREVWNLTDFGPLMSDDISDSLASNLWDLLHPPTALSGTTDQVRKYWPWLLWRIWKARNEFIFQRITTTAQSIKERAHSDFSEWFEHNPAHVRPSAPAPIAVIDKWIAPDYSFLKCNVDAAWQDSNDICGVAWVLRDHTGRVRLHGTKGYPRLLSPLEAEATALVWATNCMWNMGYDKVIFESDSLTLINALTSPDQWPRLASFTTEMQGILSRKPWQVQFNHVSRKKNLAADSLAKYALSFPLYFGSIDNFIPSWLQPSLDG